MSLPNLWNDQLRKLAAQLYGDVPAPIIGHKKAALQGGSQRELNDMASIQQNPMMDIPLRKAHGSEWVRVTPQFAQHWLTFNTANRNIEQASLGKLVQAMERGEWKDDGATIRFAPGKLLDGQNRLTAIVLTNVTLRILVVFGLDPESQVTMDTGKPRTPRDIFSIEGLDRWASATLGSAIHGMISHDKGQTCASTQRYSNFDARNYFLEHRAEIEASIRMLHDVPRKPAPLPFARSLTMHVLFSRKDRAADDNFFERLYMGDSLAKSSPIFHLRTRLMNDMTQRVHHSAFVESMYLIRTWNAVRHGTAWKTGTAIYPRDAHQDLPEIQ